MEEGHFVDGQWTHIRWLNGDEAHQGRHMRIPPGQAIVWAVSDQITGFFERRRMDAVVATA